jgi:hypothetical protein
MTITDAAKPASLLWPAGKDETSLEGGRWSEHAAVDLGLERIVAFFSADHRQQEPIRRILLSLCQDAEVIGYRQDILRDLLNNPNLVRGLQALQPTIADLNHYRSYNAARTLQLEHLAWRLGQLDLYVESVQKLQAILAGTTLHSAGLCRLRELVAAVAGDDQFQALAAELPDLMAQLREISSVTIGVNLDSRLRPEGATLLSINNQKFSGQSLLNRLFRSRARDDDFQGITALHAKSGQAGDISLRDLLRDLDQVLSSTARTLATGLNRYLTVEANFLGQLASELTFYLGAARLVHTFEERGLPMCCPEIAPVDERMTCITDLYELNLALRAARRAPEADLQQQVVPNDLRFDETGRIFILTGPNQGGKTTFTQAAGVAQVLFQAGLYVPGRGAKLSPVDGVFTHFPAEEKPGFESGRLGEEAGRLSAIFQYATRHSLILLNESLSSTSEGESLYLAQDIVRVLRMMGARAIFATHLHALAERVEAINSDTEGDSLLVSMVAEMAGLGEGEDSHALRTYKIKPGPPMGVSYARDIAARYGISLEKILQALQARGVIEKPAADSQ